MGESFDEFKPRNGWAVAAMVIFAVSFIGFLVSIFIYETQRGKPKPWWCWIGFIISIVLLVVAFATFAFINVGGTNGYHYMMRTAPDWESRKVEMIDPKDIAAIQTRKVGSFTPTNSSYYQSKTQTVVLNNRVNTSAPGMSYSGISVAPTMNYGLGIPTQSLL